MSKTSNTILALVTGAAIGAGLGLLYAPESGDKTRKKISKNAKEVKELEHVLESFSRLRSGGVDINMVETLSTAESSNSGHDS